MKTCVKCSKEKHDDEFSWKIKKQSLRQPICQDCANTYAAAYRLENRSAITKNLRAYYKANRDKLLDQKREYYEANQIEIKALSSFYYHQNIEKRRAAARESYRQNHDKIRAYQAKRYERLRHEAYAAYGGSQCSCCGEMNMGFLTIDHINGCTKEQRQLEGRGTTMYHWLKTQKYPPGYRILCFNCNMGRALNGGICPHIHFTGLAQACPEGADETSVPVTARSR